MSHDKIHCTGEIGNQTCSIREKCARYHLHLDAQKRGLSQLPYFTHTFSIGTEETLTHDISKGCCEYIENDNEHL